jgi:hypothetical protein
MRVEAAGTFRCIVGNSEVILGRFLFESQIGVGKSASHHQSQPEIDGDKPCSRQLFLTSESRLENTQRRPALENDSGEKSQRRLK